MAAIISTSLNHVNSAMRMALGSRPLNNPDVNTVAETRRARLLELIAECDSNQSKLATRAGKSPAQISQWVNASIDSKSRKPRSISNSSARHLEAVFGKPQGWMDSQPDAPLPQQPDHTAAASIFDALTAEELELLDNIRVLIDEDREEIRALVADKARRARAYLERIAADKNLKLVAQPAIRKLRFSSTMKVTPKLKQLHLFGHGVEPVGPAHANPSKRRP